MSQTAIMLFLKKNKTHQSNPLEGYLRICSFEAHEVHPLPHLHDAQRHHPLALWLVPAPFSLAPASFASPCPFFQGPHGSIKGVFVSLQHLNETFVGIRMLNTVSFYSKWIYGALSKGFPFSNASDTSCGTKWSSQDLESQWKRRVRNWQMYCNFSE